MRRWRHDRERQVCDEPLLPGGFNDWRIGLGAASSYGRGGVALLVAAAVVAVALSALTLTDERPARGRSCCSGCASRASSPAC